MLRSDGQDVQKKAIENQLKIKELYEKIQSYESKFFQSSTNRKWADRLFLSSSNIVDMKFDGTETSPIALVPLTTFNAIVASDGQVYDLNEFIKHGYAQHPKSVLSPINQKPIGPFALEDGGRLELYVGLDTWQDAVIPQLQARLDDIMAKQPGQQAQVDETVVKQRESKKPDEKAVPSESSGSSSYGTFFNINPGQSLIPPAQQNSLAILPAQQNSLVRPEREATMNDIRKAEHECCNNCLCVSSGAVSLGMVAVGFGSSSSVLGITGLSGACLVGTYFCVAKNIDRCRENFPNPNLGMSMNQ